MSVSYQYQLLTEENWSFPPGVDTDHNIAVTLVTLTELVLIVEYGAVIGVSKHFVDITAALLLL